MIVDIIKLPNVVGPTIDRTWNTSVTALLMQGGRFSDHPDVRIDPPNITVGGVVHETPRDLVKIVSTDIDAKYVYETTFAGTNYNPVCLYTRVSNQFGTNCTFFGSTPGLSRFRPNNREYVSIADAVFDGYWDITPSFTRGPVHAVVPLTFSPVDLGICVSHLRAIADGGLPQSSYSHQIKPLHREHPELTSALICGVYNGNPTHKLKVDHPRIMPYVPGKWSLADRAHFKDMVRADSVVYHSDVFDKLIFDTLSFRPCDFSISISFNDALESIIDTAIIHHFHDIYTGRMQYDDFLGRQIKSILANLLRRCALQYCEFYGIDASVFGRSQYDISSINFIRNRLDEVYIEVCDIVHDNHVAFYGYLPNLAITTSSIVSYM